jgi:hypothetical protein
LSNKLILSATGRKCKSGAPAQNQGGAKGHKRFRRIFSFSVLSQNCPDSEKQQKFKAQFYSAQAAHQQSKNRPHTAFSA